MAYANMGEICRAERKYMPFSGIERDFRKKSKAEKHMKIDAMLHFGFFRWRSRVLDFFPRFTDQLSPKGNIVMFAKVENNFG